MIYIIGAVVAVGVLFLVWMWMEEHRPLWLLSLPYVAGISMFLGVFVGGLSVVRPVAQAEAFVALILGAMAGGITAWKLRVVLKPWVMVKQAPYVAPSRDAA